MNRPATPERTLTELDHARLSTLLRRRPQTDDDDFTALLDLASVVPSRQVSPDVVTMYSQVLVQDLTGAARQTLTLCYPDDAEPQSGFVSVLSPVGAGLLGQRVGSVASWRTPDGRERQAEIVALLFQPEATGDFTT